MRVHLVVFVHELRASPFEDAPHGQVAHSTQAQHARGTQGALVLLHGRHQARAPALAAPGRVDAERGLDMQAAVHLVNAVTSQTQHGVVTVNQTVDHVVAQADARYVNTHGVVPDHAGRKAKRAVVGRQAKQVSYARQIAGLHLSDSQLIGDA